VSTQDRPAGHAEPAGHRQGAAAPEGKGSAAAPLPADVADLARRIHHGRHVSRFGTPVVPLADVVFRLRQAGHQVTADAVREAILHPPGGNR